MKSFSFFLVVILTLLTSFSSCDDDEQMADCTAASIQMSGLAGCGFVIAINNGTEETILEPRNLGDFVPNPVNGQEVCIEYTEVLDVVSVCMMGRIVELTEVQ